MKDVLLCLAALFLLSWVIYLKAEMLKLKEQGEKMAALLKAKVARDKAGVEVGSESAAWGKKPSWIK